MNIECSARLSVEDSFNDSDSYKILSSMEGVARLHSYVSSIRSGREMELLFCRREDINSFAVDALGSNLISSVYLKYSCPRRKQSE